MPHSIHRRGKKDCPTLRRKKRERKKKGKRPESSLCHFRIAVGRREEKAPTGKGGQRRRRHPPSFITQKREKRENDPSRYTLEVNEGEKRTSFISSLLPFTAKGKKEGFGEDGEQKKGERGKVISVLDIA